MRWFLWAGLCVVGVLGLGALHGLRDESPALALAVRSLPTRFAPPRDLRGEDEVLRLALTAGLHSAHLSAFQFTREARFQNALRDEVSLATYATPSPGRLSVREPPLAAFAATAAVIAAAARLGACRRRSG